MAMVVAVVTLKIIKSNNEEKRKMERKCPANGINYNILKMPAGNGNIASTTGSLLQQSITQHSTVLFRSTPFKMNQAAQLPRMNKTASPFSSILYTSLRRAGRSLGRSTGTLTTWGALRKRSR